MNEKKQAKSGWKSRIRAWYRRFRAKLNRPKHRWKKKYIGWALIVLAIPGFFLPGLQFWLLFIPGLALLADEYHWARRLLNKLKSWEKAAVNKFRSHKRKKELGKETD